MPYITVFLPNRIFVSKDRLKRENLRTQIAVALAHEFPGYNASVSSMDPPYFVATDDTDNKVRIIRTVSEILERFYL